MHSRYHPRHLATRKGLLWSTLAGLVLLLATNSGSPKAVYHRIDECFQSWRRTALYEQLREEVDDARPQLAAINDVISRLEAVASAPAPAAQLPSAQPPTEPPPLPAQVPRRPDAPAIAPVLPASPLASPEKPFMRTPSSPANVIPLARAVVERPRLRWNQQRNREWYSILAEPGRVKQGKWYLPVTPLEPPADAITFRMRLNTSSTGDLSFRLLYPTGNTFGTVSCAPGRDSAVRLPFSAYGKPLQYELIRADAEGLEVLASGRNLYINAQEQPMATAALLPAQSITTSPIVHPILPSLFQSSDILPQRIAYSLPTPISYAALPIIPTHQHWDAQESGDRHAAPWEIPVASTVPEITSTRSHSSDSLGYFGKGQEFAALRMHPTTYALAPLTSQDQTRYHYLLGTQPLLAVRPWRMRA